MSDLISRADIQYHTQLEPMGNGQYIDVEVAYKDDIDALPPAEAPYMFSEAYVEQLRFERDYLQDVVNGQWIPCSERLPEEGEKVLASTTNTVFTQVFKGTHGTSDSWWWNNNTIKTIYAWMPLPKPYREDCEE